VKRTIPRIPLPKRVGQHGYLRPTADTLRDGINELRAKIGRVNYRVLYFFWGRNVACLSHGLTKESKAPDADIDVARERKKRVAKDPDRYTAEWEV
jgi:phage-related protein